MKYTTIYSVHLIFVLGEDWDAAKIPLFHRLSHGLLDIDFQRASGIHFTLSWPGQAQPGNRSGHLPRAGFGLSSSARHGHSEREPATPTPGDAVSIKHERTSSQPALESFPNDYGNSLAPAGPGGKAPDGFLQALASGGHRRHSVLRDQYPADPLLAEQGDEPAHESGLRQSRARCSRGVGCSQPAGGGNRAKRGKRNGALQAASGPAACQVPLDLRPLLRSGSLPGAACGKVPGNIGSFSFAGSQQLGTHSGQAAL